MTRPVLAIIDVQERLFNAMDAERRDEMVANVTILASTARRLDVPVTVFHQGTIFAQGSLNELRRDERVLDIYLGRRAHAEA